MIRTVLSLVLLCCASAFGQQVPQVLGGGGGEKAPPLSHQIAGELGKVFAAAHHVRIDAFVERPPAADADPDEGPQWLRVVSDMSTRAVKTDVSKYVRGENGKLQERTLVKVSSADGQVQESVPGFRDLETKPYPARFPNGPDVIQSYARTEYSPMHSFMSSWVGIPDDDETYARATNFIRDIRGYLVHADCKQMPPAEILGEECHVFSLDHVNGETKAAERHVLYISKATRLPVKIDLTVAAVTYNTFYDIKVYKEIPLGYSFDWRFDPKAKVAQN